MRTPGKNEVTKVVAHETNYLPFTAYSTASSIKTVDKS